MQGAKDVRGRGFLPIGLLVGAVAGVLYLASGARLAPADFTFNNGSEVTSLDPATIAGIPEGRVAMAIFEGLVVADPKTLEPLPGAAESWEVSSDGRTYTFFIRENARWSNGDSLTAHDFAYSFERLLDPRTAAKHAYLLWLVKGARAFTSDVDAEGAPLHDFETVGVRTEGPRTLVLELEAPAPFFLTLLTYYTCCPVNRRSIEEARVRWPQTWEHEWLRPENIVTNGPFQVADRRLHDRIRLVKSPVYWDADSVAMRSIDVLAVEQESTMLNMYLTGAVSLIDQIRGNLAAEMMPREDFVPQPYLGTYFFRINTTRPPLDDPRVRRALSLTMPRRAICEEVLGMGQVPAYSLVPPLLPGYRSPECEREDADLARQILAEAGFGEGGAALPELEILYNTSDAHRAIAQVVAQAWRDELGLPTRLYNEEWKVFLNTQAALRFDVSRSAWISDYLDASSFLDVFVTAGENNCTGWSDPEYDRFVERATTELDLGARLSLLRDAEAILMDRLPIIPVYYMVHQNVVAPRLGGLHHNALDQHPPKFWYWMDDAELARKRDRQPADWIQVAPHGPSEGLYSPAQQRERNAR